MISKWNILGLTMLTVTCLLFVYDRFSLNSSLKTQLRRKLQSTSTINNAPQLQINTTICSKPLLLGKEHAGGWYICDILPSVAPKKCIVYSYGLGADWSFDTKLSEQYGCEVHGFDPSGKNWRNGMHGNNYANINYLKQYPTSRIDQPSSTKSGQKYFHNWGLGSISRDIYPIASIPQLWPGLGDPGLSQTNSEPWEVRSLVQTFVDLDHLHPKKPFTIVTRIEVQGKLPTQTSSININGTFSEQSNEVADKKERKRIKRENRKKLDKTTPLSNSNRLLIEDNEKFERYVDTSSVNSYGKFDEISILKIDVEGAEWDALAAMIYNEPMLVILRQGMIKQLLLEYHWDPESKARNQRQSDIMKR